jgi:hypothetical protein
MRRAGQVDRGSTRGAERVGAPVGAAERREPAQRRLDLVGRQRVAELLQELDAGSIRESGNA